MLRALLHAAGRAADGDPDVWDAFMDGIEPLADRVPYMVQSGNHDYSGECEGGRGRRPRLCTLLQCSVAIGCAPTPTRPALVSCSTGSLPPPLSCTFRIRRRLDDRPLGR
jgi:hypothetical protein